MKPRKTPAKRPASPRKKSGGGRGWSRYLLLLAGLLLLGIVYLVGSHYYVETVREEVESIVGELDPAGISMRVEDAQAGQSLLAKLRGAETSLTGVFKIDAVAASKSSIKIDATLDEVKYRIVINWEAPKPPPKPKAQVPPKAKPSTPKLAIVIDDMGTNLATAKEFLGLPFPVTPAVLPYLAHSTEVAQLYAGNKRPFLLHMPMEPVGYPSKNPGQGAIMTGDSPEKVRKLVDGALSSVPGAVGINNHMGSKATESVALMTPLMGELEKRGLVFLDSETSNNSVAANSARTAGLAYAKRDVFLDNESSDAYIDAQMLLAVERAKKNGTAVAIGHDRPETLKALKAFGSKISDLGVELVPVTEVLHANGR